MTRAWTALVAGLMFSTATGTSAVAASLADFYRGKTVTIFVGVGVGGEYDLHARLVSRYIGNHIPGNPNVVVQNMPGGGGIKMANYLFSNAPPDGASLGIISNNFATVQTIGGKGVQFDVRKFQWIGAITPVVQTMAVWHTTGIKSINELRKRSVVAGASGRGAITYVFPALLNEVLGTRFKIVTGYKGGNGVNLAMERGEVAARANTWSSWKTTRAQWLKEKKIIVVAQAGPRARDLDAPSVEALTKTPQDRQLVDMVASGMRLGRPLVTSPGLPSDRLAALRAAYRATMNDPDFRKEAAKLKVDVDPVYGEQLQKIAAGVVGTPKEIVTRAKALME
ncbi:MAG: Bug family tripartite tricarboxylate transporter substrate binding protein [Xanthobacteraceae bacterium]